MFDLVVLMLLTVSLAWCADHIVLRPMIDRTWHREVLFTIVVFIILAGFAGLRKWYNDTETYRHAYDLIGTYPAYWSQIKFKLGKNFGFDMICAGLKTLGVISQDYFMLFAVVSVAMYMFFLHRYSVDYAITLFLFFATGEYIFMCAAIKQTTAVGLCLIATHCFLKRKHCAFVILVLLASTIHPYALMYLFIPLFTYKPWTWRTYFFVSLFIAAGFALQPLLGTIVDVTTMIGEEFTVSGLSGAGVNVFRVMVCNVPLLLSYTYRKQMFAESTKAENLFVNLSMLNGAIMFVGLFGTANYFARLANYFLIFQVIALPWMLRRIKGWDYSFMRAMMILGYAAYFYYENGIVQPFDNSFHRLTISEYLALPR